MHPNNDAAASAGVNNNTSVTPERVMKALVASYNAGGGIAGRRIMPYYEELRSSSNNFEGDLAAACAAFTQDDHVAFVVNAVGLYSESFQTCLAHAEVPVFSDLAPDRQDARQFPLLITPDDLLADTRVTQVVQRLAASGWLTSRNRIGVVIEDCPVDNRIFADTLKPVLASAGLSLAATANPQCFQSISDLGTIAGQMGNAVLDFRSKRVDRVMFVSIGQEGTLSYEFMLAASQQNWYPGYAMSSMSYATTVAAQSGVSRQEIANSRGIGWVPPNDSSDPRQSPETSGAKDCMARLGKQGLHPTTAVDDYSSWLVCDEMALANATLRASNGNASPGAMSRGVRVAATGFVSALTVAGRVGTWDNGRIGPAAFRYFSWVASKGGFLYTSSARPF